MCQNKVFDRMKDGIMSAGVKCEINPFVEYGDVVHPCVKHFDKPFRGHNWWMVYTPYYSANALVENPILCWGESLDGYPPTKWNIECHIENQQETGYNSDPFIELYNNDIVIFWRENSTPDLLKRKLAHGTYCKIYKENGELTDKILLIEESGIYEDRETCPAFVFTDDGIIAYGMHLVFKNKFIHTKMPKRIQRLFDNFVSVTDVLGLFSQQQFRGVALWKGMSLFQTFEYVLTNKIENCNTLYRPWHMDVFVYQGEQYMIIQTNQSNADLCLAKMIAPGKFRLYKRPLITNHSIDKVGIYKPTAGVIDNQFFLYYTAQDKENRKLNQLYLSTMPFDNLLQKVEK